MPITRLLSTSGQHHLRAAQGWLELGDRRSANEELKSITPALRARPDVLAMRWQVYSEARHWELALVAGRDSLRPHT